MEWEKILWAVLLGMMLVFLIPRAKAMFAATRKAEVGEWSGVVVPLALVVAFIALLVMLVR